VAVAAAAAAVAAAVVSTMLCCGATAAVELLEQLAEDCATAIHTVVL
jgi:hypothetical protein